MLNLVCNIFSDIILSSLVHLGLGYRLTIGEKLFNFPHVERPPPEGYLNQDYIA